MINSIDAALQTIWHPTFEQELWEPFVHCPLCATRIGMALKHCHPKQQQKKKNKPSKMWVWEKTFKFHFLHSVLTIGWISANRTAASFLILYAKELKLSAWNADTSCIPTLGYFLHTSCIFLFRAFSTAVHKPASAGTDWKWSVAGELTVSWEAATFSLKRLSFTVRA